MSVSKRGEKGIPELHPFIEAFGMEETMNRLGWDEQRRDAWVEHLIATLGLGMLIKSVGMKMVVDAVGVKRVIEYIGVDKVIRYFIDNYGIEEFIALLSEEKRQRLRELIG